MGGGFNTDQEMTDTLLQTKITFLGNMRAVVILFDHREALLCANQH